MTPEIEINRTWNIDSVRNTCIKNSLYTQGTSEEYEHMLSWVKRLYPNTENLYFIANDIMNHSEEQTITNIMFLLEREAVTTTYEIEDK